MQQITKKVYSKLLASAENLSSFIVLLIIKYNKTAQKISTLQYANCHHKY